MIALLLAACLPQPEADSADRPLTVLAASSLTDALTALEARFEADHPGVDVRLSFAGSHALSAQVRHGAPADVLAVAHRRHLDGLALGGPAQPFAQNALVLARPAGALGPTRLADLPDTDTVVLADPAAPIGAYTAAALDHAAHRLGPEWRAATEARVASYEPNVRLAAAKVLLGEADAAIVYASDAHALPGLDAVPLDAPVRPTLWHAAPLDAPSTDLATAWMALVESPVGQDLLARHGLLPAP